ncbi:MAG: PRC-barrel domain-containing protein [Syntrophorhabdales bacterium]
MAFLAVVIGLLLFFPSPSLGSGGPQDGVAVGMRGVRLAGPGQGAVPTVESLKGSTVIDPQQEPLGRIEDIVLDHATGAISYVVMEPGTKDRLIPIPFSVFGVTTKGRLVLDIDEGRVYTAPSYAKGGSPNWRDPVWDERVAAFWGRVPKGVIAEAVRTPSPPHASVRHGQ